MAGETPTGPHPAVLMGRLIDICDQRANHGANRQAKGVVVIAALVVAALVAGGLLAWLPDYGVIEVLGGAVLIAHRSLMDHLRDVRHALGQGIDAGRRAVARIVGRDDGCSMAEAHQVL